MCFVAAMKLAVYRALEVRQSTASPQAGLAWPTSIWERSRARRGSCAPMSRNAARTASVFSSLLRIDSRASLCPSGAGSARKRFTGKAFASTPAPARHTISRRARTPRAVVGTDHPRRSGLKARKSDVQFALGNRCGKAWMSLNAPSMRTRAVRDVCWQVWPGCGAVHRWRRVHQWGSWSLRPPGPRWMHASEKARRQYCRSQPPPNNMDRICHWQPIGYRQSGWSNVCW